MLNIKQEKGFTLVELAIVLTIVGLLIGGILKGQQLIQNARVTATVAQINAIEAATTNFRDAYGELPGDMMDADTRIQGCNAGCNISGGTPGNNKIGYKNWDYAIFQSTPIGNVALSDGTCPSTLPATAVLTTASTDCKATFAETVLFWLELQNAALISSVTQEAIDTSSTIATFGGTIPEAKIGGGFVVGNSSGTGPSSTTALGNPAAYTILGTVIVMVAKPQPTTAGAGTYDMLTSGMQALKPSTAANIDRKIDDGLPSQGEVQAYGGAVSGAGNTCFGNTAPYAYQENIDSKDCGLILRMQR